jgi:hypothetical protein
MYNKFWGGKRMELTIEEKHGLRPKDMGIQFELY